jgi:late competence protein required for DNA uptake (superfamily II DNA/RNA helicase)
MHTLNCPECNHTIDSENFVPVSIGKLTLCLNCLQILTFTTDNGLQSLSDETFYSLNSSEQEAIKIFNSGLKPPIKHCPRCNGEFTNMETDTPGVNAPLPGDIAYCRRCFQLLRFDSNLELIIINDEDFIELDASLRAQINRELIKIKNNVDQTN